MKRNPAKAPTPAQTARLQSGRLKNGRMYATKRGGAVGTPAEIALQGALSNTLPK